MKEQDDVTKLIIQELRLEISEQKKNCEVWKAKYKTL